MNRKIGIVIVSVIFIMLTLIGCKEESVVEPIKERLVKTKIVENSKVAETLYYFGFVEPGEVKAYALKTSGKIEKINVEIGDYIEIGDVLVSLDDYEYNLGAKASSEQINLARLDLDKAREARNFYEKTYNDSLVLYQEGVMSKFKLDEIKLQFDISSKEAEQALKTLNQANIDYDFKSSSLDDTALISDMNGYVVEVLNKEGELVSQGYPIVVVRSEDNLVKVGMSQEDIKRVNIGDVASVNSNEVVYNGIINNINLMPDQTSRTYSVEIKLEKGDFIIGESCKVYIELEKIEGIWINITDVMNDGVDYVYIVKDGRATRRDIELHEINNSLVRVTNLEAGDEMIVSGKKALSEGYRVRVEGDENE